MRTTGFDGCGSKGGRARRLAASALAAAVAASYMCASAAGGGWSVRNFENRLKVVTNAVEEGAECLAIYGATVKCDTAWCATSQQLAVRPGAREFVLSADMASTRLVLGGPAGTESGWGSAILWLNAAGRQIAANTMPHLLIVGDGRFRRVCEWGRIPDGAVACTVRFGFDTPDLGINDRVCIRGFRLDTAPAGGTEAAALEREWGGGQFKARLRDTLYPPPDVGVPKATLRDDGMTLIDGKPFFPIGIYSVCRREFNGNSLDVAFADLAAAGFNFAHTYGNAYEPGFFAAARKHGFKLWVAARMPDRKLLDVGRREPAVLAWYLGDDTSYNTTPQELSDCNAAVKAVDPNRLTCQADPVNSDRVLSRYACYVRYTDVFMPEIYPVRGEAGDISDSTCVAVTIRDMKRAADDVRDYGDGRPHGCWPIIQYFKGWDGWRHFPTADQLRATTWAAVIHGAHGVTWYTYGGFEDKKSGRKNEGITSSPERWRTICALVKQLRALEDVLAERTPPDQPKVDIVSGPSKDPLGLEPSVTALMKRHGGREHLFAVNASTEPVTARVTMPCGAVVTEAFKPFGVLVREFNGDAVK